MQIWALVLILICVAGYGHVLGRRRAISFAAATPASLHSLPFYHGAYLALWVVVPSLLAISFWLVAQGPIIESLIISGLTPDTQALSADRLSLVLNDINNVASGDIPSREPTPEIAAAAQKFSELKKISNLGMVIISLGLGIACLWWAKGKIPRNLEPVIRWNVYSQSS